MAAEAWLEIQFPDRPSRLLAVRREPAQLIGRSDEAELPLDHPSISRRHAVLYRGERGFDLEDCGSKNGSFIDRLRLEGRRAVEPGQLLRFGDVLARLHEAGSGIDIGAEQRRRIRTGQSLAIQGSWLDTGDPIELARSTLAAILELSGYSRGFILLRRTDDLWTVKASASLDSSQIDHWEFNGSRSAIARCVREGKPVVYNNIVAGHWIAEQNSVIDAGIRAILCLPMRMDESLIGVLYADDQNRIPGINEADLAILESLTSHATMLIALEHLDRAIQRIQDQELPRSDWYLAAPDPADEGVVTLR